MDHYLAVASVLGLARGYAWPVSLAQQCAGQHESSIPHWDQASKFIGSEKCGPKGHVSPPSRKKMPACDFWNVNPKMLLPSAPLWLVLLTLLLLLTLISAARR